MAYLFLLVAVGALGMLGVLHKVADHRRCRPEAINVFLFLWAAAILWAFCLWRAAPALPRVPAVALAVAAVCGTCAAVAILNFQRGIRFGRISTSWLIVNLSTAVPTLLSILIYREAISARRAFALLLVLGALLLLWLDRRREEERARLSN